MADSKFEIAIDDHLLDETFASMDEANTFAANKRRGAATKIVVALAGTFAAQRDSKPLPTRTAAAPAAAPAPPAHDAQQQQHSRDRR